MSLRAVLLIAISVTLLAACESGSNEKRIVGSLASDRIELTADVGEPVTAILVEEGDAVTAGQVLLRQDSRRAEARLAEAEAALRQAEARLDELLRGPRREQIAAARANVEGAARELEFRRAEYERIREIHARQLASPDVLDRAKAALDAARANEELRRAQLQELLNGTTVEELAQAEQQLRQAEAHRDRLALDVEFHTLHAPVDGIVDSRLFETGERPKPGQAVLVLLPGAQPHARIYVPEARRVHVAPGMQARVLVDGLQEPLPGRVRWVAAEAMFTPYFALTERDRGHLTFEAKVDLEYDGRRLPDGVPVEVELDE